MRGCPRDQATDKTSAGEVLYSKTRPLHPHHTPSLLLFTAYKNGLETFYEKVLNGRKHKKRRREAGRRIRLWQNMEQRHFPRLRTVTYNHNVYTGDTLSKNRRNSSDSREKCQCLRPAVIMINIQSVGARLGTDVSLGSNVSGSGVGLAHPYLKVLRGGGGWNKGCHRKSRRQQEWLKVSAIGREGDDEGQCVMWLLTVKQY